MNRYLSWFAVLMVCCGSAGADWLQFRGSTGTGVADKALPISWSESKNIGWTADLPGRGASSPIVVKDRVVVTCSGGVLQDRLYVICFSTLSGDELWRREFWATGRTYTHPVSCVAAPTPASDGDSIFAFFSSNDLICLDLEGRLQWYRGLAHDFPKAGNDVGMSSSPVVIGKTVIVQIENQGDSFASGIDTATGETRWRIRRDPQANWSSPAVFPGSGQRKDAVLLQSPGGLTAHDPTTGEQVWQFEEEFGTIPSPVAVGNRVYLPSGGVTALDFTDDSASPEIAWKSERLRAGSASPVVYDGHVFTMNGGVLKCADAADGSVQWELRVGGRHWATPVVAGGKMYCVDESGDANVIDLSGEKGKIVGSSKFGETVQGTPAVSDGAMYVRSDQHLWKISSTE